MLKNYWSQLWCGVPHTGHLTEEKLVCREVVHLPGGSKGAENSPCLPFLGRMSAPGIQEETGKEKKNPQWCLKLVRQIFFSSTVTVIGTTAMGFSSWGERLGSTQNTAWANGNLQPGSRMEVSRWKFTNGKHQGWWGFWLNDLTEFLLKTDQGDQASPGDGRGRGAP